MDEQTDYRYDMDRWLEDELEAYYSGMDDDGLDFSLDDIEDEDYGVLPF